MTQAQKIDLFKLNKQEYATPKRPTLIEMKPARYLGICGEGPPGGDVFQITIGALYGMAFTLKMTRKFGGEQDYVVCKLEGQYWDPAGTCDTLAAPPKELLWKLMIRTPDFVTAAELKRARKALTDKGKGERVDEVVLEKLSEGRCLQMLHVGPYEKEHETLAVMQEHAEREGLRWHGRHHEIYLSDPRRVPAERLKTILRRPVTKG